MMRDVNEVFAGFEDLAWNDESRLIHLVRFIHSKHLGAELEEYLQAAAAEERAECSEGGGKRYLAEFEPQAWQNDYAVPVDPEGETEWDCTAFVTNPPEWVSKDYFGAKFQEELDSVQGYFVDNDDVLQKDPAAPEWVRRWRGPFTITVTAEDADS